MFRKDFVKGQEHYFFLLPMLTWVFMMIFCGSRLHLPITKYEQALSSGSVKLAEYDLFSMLYGRSRAST